MTAGSYDVVLGGGVAGCVLASRLSEDAGRSVCLAEARPDYGPDLPAHELPEAGLRARLGTYWHPVRTWATGPAADPSAVVDGEGRVHGVANLRVADASVLPTVPAANTQLPVLAVAEMLAAAVAAAPGS